MRATRRMRVKSFRSQPKRPGARKTIRLRPLPKIPKRTLSSLQRRPEIVAEIRSLLASVERLRREEIYFVLGVPRRYEAKHVAKLLTWLVRMRELIAYSTGEADSLGKPGREFRKNPHHLGGGRLRLSPGRRKP